MIPAIDDELMDDAVAVLHETESEELRLAILAGDRVAVELHLSFLARLGFEDFLADPFDVSGQVAWQTFRMVDQEQKRARKRKLTHQDVVECWRVFWKARARTPRKGIAFAAAVGGTARRNGSMRTWPHATELVLQHPCRHGTVRCRRPFAQRKLMFGVRVYGQSFETYDEAQRGPSWRALVDDGDDG